MTERFEPPPGTPGYGKLDFSDKVSMPRSIGAELTRRQYEVPWHFELTPVSPHAFTASERERERLCFLL